MQLFFLGNIGQENVFYDIVERKIVFLGYKNIKFTNAKNSHFSKAVYPWCWSKNSHFSNFLFRQNRHRKCLFWSSRTKNAFLGYKNVKFKRRKIWHFTKEVNTWFQSKNGHFSNFFFRQNRQGKCLFWSSRTKKTSF